MELNLTTIILELLKQYGLAGLAIAGCLYYVRVIETKLDRLTNLMNKTFGVMLALVDGKKRAEMSKGDDDA